eukprot:CAMPEP_0175099752 /NCGR_PEP_ID=MMETSP0086_2-20121207/6642_1 /TAXON_ID=136419 /ORGANISM="Unknown Unknown, Strain D1" /LENGTH=132 /DNA_ID=CAMNT_0016373659 /DNA_START=417 /DNA_END=815 /DNA_ORIENTATION=-
MMTLLLGDLAPVSWRLKITGNEQPSRTGSHATTFGFAGAFRVGNVGVPTYADFAARAKRSRANAISNIPQPDSAGCSCGTVVGSDQYRDHIRVGLCHPRAQRSGMARDRSKAQNTKQKLDHHPERCGVFPKT